MRHLKVQSFLFAVLAVIIAPGIVSAKETTVEVASANDLQSCVSTDNNICKLTSNIQLSATMDIANNVTIDLNGKEIVDDGSFTETTGLIIVLPGASLTVNDSVGTGKISSGDKLYAGIQVTKKGYDTTNTTTLVVNGGTIEGYYYGIAGNGTRHNTSITINGGVIQGTCVDDNQGIYHPQNGTLIVNGGTIKGSTGIEMRAGELTVNGGTIIGTYKPSTVTPNGNGTTTKGAGIAVAQHNTRLDTKVTINNGTIKGFSAFYESNPQNNDAASLAKVVLAIKGGNFETMNDGTVVVYSENKTGFISGGTFNKDVTSTLIAEGLVSKKVGATYTVAKENTITISNTTNGTVATDIQNAIVGEKVTMTLTPAAGYEVATIEVKDSSNNTITVTNNQFVMPNSAVTVTVTFKEIKQTVDIPVLNPTDKVEDVTIGIKEDSNVENVLLDSLNKNEELAGKLENTSVKVEVEVNKVDENTIDKNVLDAIKEKNNNLVVNNFFDITIAVKNANTEAQLGTLAELTDEIELMILLPENLRNTDKNINRVYYVVREHEGNVEILPATLSEDGTHLVFKSKLFSTFALAYEDVADVKEENPNTIDNVLLYVGLGSFSVVGLGVAEFLRRKQQKAN